MRDTLEELALNNLVTVGVGVNFTDLAYADDIAIATDNTNDLQAFVDKLAANAGKIGLKINCKKTKLMLHLLESYPPIIIGEDVVETVTNFVYLGSQMSIADSTKSEVSRRIGIAADAFARLKSHVWSDQRISTDTKVKLYNISIIPILLYASETWIPLAADSRRLNSFDFKCRRKILGLTWRDKIRNSRVADATSNLPCIPERIFKNRLRYLGHIFRMPDSRLPKRVLISDPLTKRDGWRRKVGGQFRDYWRQILQDFKALKLEHLYNFGYPLMSILADSAQSRPGWKNLCDNAWNASITWSATHGRVA
jgi:transcriptional regulator